MAINPFSFEAATNLSINDVLDWYVPDHNQGPLINSTKNLFLFGERGCGKSMTLRYFSLEAAIARGKKSDVNPDLSYVGIYVKCNAPLIWKREYELIKRDDEGRAKAALLSEYILSLWILRALIDQISLIPNLYASELEATELSQNLSMILGCELPTTYQCLYKLNDILENRLDAIQYSLTKRDPGEDLSSSRGFNSLVIRVLIKLQNLKALSNSHFMIMLDDAQDLYTHQREAVNSWVAYRDHSIFSLKIAVARKQSYNFSTSTGASILEIHDYSSLDLQTPFQNSNSSYAKFVKDVLDIRLQKSGINCDASNFFPECKAFLDDVKAAHLKCEKDFISKNPDANSKQINDHVYKRGRAYYFRDRSPKANRPTYAGLETITEISTGVTRTVLEIAWRAFDLLLSQDRTKTTFPYIPPSMQSEAIFKCSEKLWETLNNGLDKRSARISVEDSKKLNNFFEQLGIYFRERLCSEISEPRVLSFVLSELNKEENLTLEIDRILKLALEHTLIFTRPYVSRDGFSSETLYTPNKLLWPTYGIDVVGQSGRASLKVSDVMNAMVGKKIPLRKSDEKSISNNQMGLDYE